MNRSLVPCPACAELVFEGACVCPHCGAKAPCASAKLGGAAALLGLGLTLTATACVQPMYGFAIVDGDADGYEIGVDCDDEDPDIFPDAPETAGDGVDSNCDGEDDT